ncbi:hypothetical protein Hanom_Chr09g00864921 [Helianthus anomalus]
MDGLVIVSIFLHPFPFFLKGRNLYTFRIVSNLEVTFVKYYNTLPENIRELFK